MTRQTVIRHDDDLGGMAYPFLPAALEWEIVSRPLDNAEVMKGPVHKKCPTFGKEFLPTRFLQKKEPENEFHAQQRQLSRG